MTLGRLQPLAPYLKRYRPQFIQGAIAAVLYNLSKVVMPLVIGRAVDDIQHHGTRRHHLPQHRHPARRLCRRCDLPLSHPLDHHRRFP